MTLDVSAYREQVEAQTAAREEEFYRHFSGHKPTLELAPITERYAELGSLNQVRAMADRGDPLELQRHAGEMHLAHGLEELTDRAANAQAAATVEWDGGELPYRAVRNVLLNEPDRVRRSDLHRRRCDVTERELNPILTEAVVRQRDLVSELGAESTLMLYERYGYDPRGLHRATERFLADTDDLYRQAMDAELRRRVGVPLEGATPADAGRLMRAVSFDAGFPTDRALPALRATLAELGIDLDGQANVTLDIDARPGKVPRAFCSAVRVPDRVVLVILPVGGTEDYQALFHEAGHTEHFAHTSRELVAEHRLLGDNAVTEGWAFLLEHLVSSREWLRSRLDFTPIDEYVRYQALIKLFFIRRYAAKLSYELELQADAPLDRLGDRYAALLGAATGLEYPTGDHLEDVDPGFYCTCYLRAWAFERQMAGHLRERFGGDWFRRRRAGSLLRELWELGQSLRADDLLAEVTGERLQFDVLAEEAHAALG